MPELRQDPISGRWVAVATERAKRPDDFVKRGEASTPGICPFEYGNEAMTPPETLAFRDDAGAPETPGWSVRVVPNKFPAFAPENGTDIVEGLYHHRKAYGDHEVVIHGPDHALSIATYPVEQVEKVLLAYKLRYLYHKEQPYGRYIQIIINHGKESGASLEHSHSQILVVPIVPRIPLEDLAGAVLHYNEHNRCVFCDMIASERAAKIRLVEESESFVVFAPYAGKLPFETWILPRMHRPLFEDISDEERHDLATIFRSTLRRFYHGLNDPPFNMYLHTSPPGYEQHEAYHWHMSITPKLTIPAGFEMATGMNINSTLPEAAAEFLRNVHVSDK